MPSEQEQVERWTNYRRRDGCRIVKGLDCYLIMPAAEGLPVDKCPCCDKPLLTVEAAQKLADYIFPMMERG
jgi:hypothetical protein